ncbi:MAG: hypothetical protein WDZ93_00135 [Candidatus Paceibacterota bacterium]
MFELGEYGQILGILAGALMFASYLFYIAAILRGTTKPNRATWFMLATISFVIALSYHEVGAENTWWVAGGASLGTFLVALLSITKGTGGWGRLDRLCILVAFGSLAIYVLSSDPLITLMLILLMDGAAMAPTIHHAYIAPDEEDTLAWTLTSIADLLAIIVIERWTVDIAVYPIYMLLINGSIVFLLLLPRLKRMIRSK